MADAARSISPEPAIGSMIRVEVDVIAAAAATDATGAGVKY
jgi:hypothetical protein